MNNSLINFADPNFVAGQYLPVFIFLIIAIALSCVIILIPFIINKMRPDEAKNSQYECGFEGEGKVRGDFNVQFYLVAILFIIFDLEIAFLFPWAVSLEKIGVFGFWSMMIFLTLLIKVKHLVSNLKILIHLNLEKTLKNGKKIILEYTKI